MSIFAAVHHQAIQGNRALFACAVTAVQFQDNSESEMEALLSATADCIADLLGWEAGAVDIFRLILQSLITKVRKCQLTCLSRYS